MDLSKVLTQGRLTLAGATEQHDLGGLLREEILDRGAGAGAAREGGDAESKGWWTVITRDNLEIDEDVA